MFAPWSFIKGGKVLEVEVEGALVANKPESLIRAARDGVGILYTIHSYVAPWISSGELIPLLEEWIPPPSDRFFLYYPSRRQNPAALTAFIDFLRVDKRRSGQPEQTPSAAKMEVPRNPAKVAGGSASPQPSSRRLK